MSLEYLNECVVVIISNEPWGKMRFIKHQYAIAISKYTDVYFVNPSNSYNPKNLFSFSVKEEIIHEKLHVLSIENNLPNINYRHPFFKLNDYTNSIKLKKHLDKKHKGKDVLIWQFDIFRFLNMNAFKDEYRIYHACDPYEFVPTDKVLPKKADMIVYTSDNFATNYQKYNKKMIHIPHGIFDEDLEYDPVHVKEIKKTEGSFLLFAGTISFVTDFDLTINLMKAIPETKLIICGRLKLQEPEHKRKWEELIALDNVKFIGQLSIKEMNNYARASELCLVIYNQWHVNRFPNKRQSLLKFTSYITQSKPILSTQRSEMDSLQGNTIYFAEDDKSFIEETKRILNIPVEERIDQDKIDEYLNNVMYDKLINKVLELTKK